MNVSCTDLFFAFSDSRLSLTIACWRYNQWRKNCNTNDKKQQNINSALDGSHSPMYGIVKDVVKIVVSQVPI